MEEESLKVRTENLFIISLTNNKSTTKSLSLVYMIQATKHTYFRQFLDHKLNNDVITS